MNLSPFIAARSGLIALGLLVAPALAQTAPAGDPLCVECLRVRVGPPSVVRGPFPDELDAPFTAIKLADGVFRGFSANGTTFAIEGATLRDMGGERRAVLEAGPAGSLNECGRWLTSALPVGGRLIGFVHQESICDYGPQGQTHKSMALAISDDDGLHWTDLGTVITGTDTPQPGKTTGEGDCTLVDGHDGFLYAYCLRNSDWQTIVARAPASDLTNWRKYHDGAWREPGVGGAATDIGFVGPGGGYMPDFDAVVAIANDTWFGGLRLSLSRDKLTFVDLDEPLLPVDGSDWARPADTDLAAYLAVLNPEDGSNTVAGQFLLSYIHVPAGKGFDSRYLVLHDVTLSATDNPGADQVGLALTRWISPEGRYATTTGPLTGASGDYRMDRVVGYMLTRPPEDLESVKIVECAIDESEPLGQRLAAEGSCETSGLVQQRTAGWLHAVQQPETLPIYRCYAEAARTHFASDARDCEGLGTLEFTLGYGLAP